MSDNDSHIIYTAKDIQKYLAGEMPNEQMHAIEKAALDDPLLAEAIEGYAGMEEQDWNEALAALKGKFTIAETTPVISIGNRQQASKWKVAAAVVVLLAGLGLGYIFTANKTPVITAKQDTEIKKADTVTTDELADTSSQMITKNEAEIATSAQKRGLVTSADTGRLYSRPGKESNAANDFVYTSKSKEDYKVAASPPASDNNSLNRNTNPAVADDLRNKSSASNEASTSNAIAEEDTKKATANNADIDKFYEKKTTPANKPALNNFSGLVVAKDSAPVAFAQITTSPKNRSFYTDKNGYFNIVSQDTAVNVEVNSAGYLSKKLRFKQTETNQVVVMEPVSVPEQKLSSNKNSVETSVAKMKREQKKKLKTRRKRMQLQWMAGKITIII